jgi:integrase
VLQGDFILGGTMQARTRYQYGELKKRKRKNGPDVWQFRYYKEDGKKKAMLIGTVERLPTKSDALKAIEHLRMQINAHLPQARLHRVTVGGLIDRFASEELPNARRFQTQAEYHTYFDSYIRPQWGKLFLDQVKPTPVMNWLKSLQSKTTGKPLAPKTKAHIRNAFFLLFQWARRWELVDSNPIELVEQSAKRLRIPRVPTPEQFQALLGELQEPYRTMALIAGCIGLRACEVVALRWGNVDWQGLAIDVKRSVVAGREDETKTEASERRLPLDPALATRLLNWRAQAHYIADSDFIFAGDSGRPRWQAMILKDYFQPAADRAGIGKVGWHALRHSYRAWLKRCGTPLEVQKDLMRHANVKVTAEIYGIDQEVTPAHREANTAVVKRLLGD